MILKENERVRKRSRLRGNERVRKGIKMQNEWIYKRIKKKSEHKKKN